MDPFVGAVAGQEQLIPVSAFAHGVKNTFCISIGLATVRYVFVAARSTRIAAAKVYGVFWIALPRSHRINPYIVD
jgi:hypothetical protein